MISQSRLMRGQFRVRTPMFLTSVLRLFTEGNKLNRSSRLIFGVLLACIPGCDSGEDSWSLYERQHIYNGGAPSVSPDGRSIVYSSPVSGRGDIYRITREGVTRLTHGEEFDAQPIFSPSGDRIAYVRESGGWRHVWVMDADGGHQTRLTVGRVLDDLVGFSPDGTQLYFTRALPSSGLGREAECQVMDTDGRNLRPQPPGLCRGIPDEIPIADGGRILAFGPYASSTVRVLDSRTRMELERLKIPPGFISPPSLTYDGKAIVFSLLEADANDLSVYLVRRDTLTLETLK